jgi:hypothetical protein
MGLQKMLYLKQLPQGGIRKYETWRLKQRRKTVYPSEIRCRIFRVDGNT